MNETLWVLCNLTLFIAGVPLFAIHRKSLKNVLWLSSVQAWQVWEQRENWLLRASTILSSSKVRFALFSLWIKVSQHCFNQSVPIFYFSAQERAGGRVCTAQLERGYLELGAQWIHGEDNPIYHIAHKQNLLSNTTSAEGLGPYISILQSLKLLCNCIEWSSGHFNILF